MPYKWTIIIIIIIILTSLSVCCCVQALNGRAGTSLLRYFNQASTFSLGTRSEKWTLKRGCKHIKEYKIWVDYHLTLQWFRWCKRSESLLVLINSNYITMSKSSSETNSWPRDPPILLTSRMSFLEQEMTVSSSCLHLLPRGSRASSTSMITSLLSITWQW